MAERWRSPHDRFDDLVLVKRQDLADLMAMLDTPADPMRGACPDRVRTALAGPAAAGSVPILLTIAEIDTPITWSQEGLDDACFFCGADHIHYTDNPQHDRYVEHSKSCPWIEARRLLGMIVDPHDDPITVQDAVWRTEVEVHRPEDEKPFKATLVFWPLPVDQRRPSADRVAKRNQPGRRRGGNGGQKAKVKYPDGTIISVPTDQIRRPERPR